MSPLVHRVLQTETVYAVRIREVAGLAYRGNLIARPRTGRGSLQMPYPISGFRSPECLIQPAQPSSRPGDIALARLLRQDVDLAAQVDGCPVVRGGGFRIFSRLAGRS